MFSFLRSRPPLRQTPTSSVTVHGREIEVRRKPYKRSIGLTLHVNGRVRVSAPKTTPLAKIVEFVESHREWIESNLAKYELLRRKHPRKRMVQGERFAFMGRELALGFREGKRARAAASVQGDGLVIEIPQAQWRAFRADGEHPELWPVLMSFYQRAGREHLGARLEHLASAMELKPAGVSFRAQKTRWGSCSSKGRISLNWRLIFAPPAVIDYVLVHELSHLRCYDHSPRFWSLVATQIPDFAKHRDWLRDHAYGADFLARRSELHV